MLVLRQRTLSPGMVRRIRHLRGVTRVEQFSLGPGQHRGPRGQRRRGRPRDVPQLHDPAGWRTFQPEWNRVAGGEMALRHAVPQAGLEEGLRAARCPLRRTRGARRCLLAAGAAGRRGRQRELGQDPRDGAGQRPADLDRARTRRPTSASRSSAWSATPPPSSDSTSRPVSASTRRPCRTSSSSAASADAVGSYSYTVLGGGRIAPQQALGDQPHLDRDHADHRVDDLQHPDVPPAARGARRDRRRRARRRRSTRASTAAATSRASSPARRRCRTTPSDWPSTSTSRRTNAEPSARSAARWWRSSRSGASPGAAPGTTPTRCTSS